MRRAVLATVSTVASLVMLLSFKTQSATPVTTVSSTPARTSSGSSSGGTKTVTGDAVDTRYGPVQVKVTVTNGKITAASAVDYPQSNPRDAQINDYAVPTLNAEAVKAGSASIDMVSGATYTSTGYVQSLQSALDRV